MQCNKTSTIKPNPAQWKKKNENLLKEKLLQSSGSTRKTFAWQLKKSAKKCFQVDNIFEKTYE